MWTAKVVLVMFARGHELLAAPTGFAALLGVAALVFVYNYFQGLALYRYAEQQ